jgi:hypothetical protein
MTLSEVDPITEARRKEIEGVEFEGVLCSATEADMLLLREVKDWARQGHNIHFEFDNGSVLQIGPSNVEEFDKVWTAFKIELHSILGFEL